MDPKGFYAVTILGTGNGRGTKMGGATESPGGMQNIIRLE